MDQPHSVRASAAAHRNEPSAVDDQLQSLNRACPGMANVILRARLWVSGPSPSGPASDGGPATAYVDRRLQLACLGQLRPVRRSEQCRRRHTFAQLQRLVLRHRCISSHVERLWYLSLPSLIPFHSSVTVGNGARLAVTHTAVGTIPTTHAPLHLHNVLVTRSIVKNLISVRQLTRDNNISIEFDPVGFSIKDLPTRKVMLRCDNTSDMYPLRLPLHQVLSASSTASIKLWHSRLGHPGTTTPQQLLRSLNYTCNKTAAHSCYQCCVGKHTRLPFQHSETPTPSLPKRMTFYDSKCPKKNDILLNLACVHVHVGIQQSINT
jgi:hypothetical protein